MPAPAAARNHVSSARRELPSFPRAHVPVELSTQTKPTAQHPALSPVPFAEGQSAEIRSSLIRPAVEGLPTARALAVLAPHGHLPPANTVSETGAPRLAAVESIRTNVVVSACKCCQC